VQVRLLALSLAVIVPLFAGISPLWSAQGTVAAEFTSRTGAVSGRITLAGAVPKPKPLPVFKSRSYCGAEVRNETLLVNHDGGLKNGVVILRPVHPVWTAAREKLVLDNQRCAFTPHVQVASVGSELLLKNSDPILHTVHARLGTETLFNVGLPHWRQVVKRLDRPGLIRIDCDVLHTWMSAVIVVTDSPFVAISDAKGEFSISGLSAGDYQMEVWHERLGVQRQKVSLTENGVASIEIVYSAEKLR
jgi:hypothetical protein